MLLCDCKAMYLREAADLAPSTIKKIGYEISRWNKVTLGPPVPLISKDTFSDFRTNCLKQGLAARSIESNIDTIRLLMRFAVEAGAISTIPPVGRRLKKPRPRPTPLEVDDLRALFVAADVATWPNHVRCPAHWWRAFFALGYWTGLRLSDLCWKISWDHFTVRQSLIAFPAGKTGHFHEYPIHPRLLPHLARVSNRGLILGTPRSYKCFRRELAFIAAAAGVNRRVTAKNLRQASVSEWSKVSRDAGRIIHGCGLGDVRDHYVDAYAILQDAMPRMPWPFPDRVQGRQLQLF